MISSEPCLLFAIFIIILNCKNILPQPQPEAGPPLSNDIDVCRGKTTCGECTAASPNCFWCSKPPKDFKSSRCDTLTNLHRNNCRGSDVVSTNSSLDYIRNETPRDANGSVEVIQLSPQHMKLKLRPNVPLTFEVTFRVAENYPVDLYFLMDVSHTMRDYLGVLASISDKLATSITTITKDFRLGFGTFVDKTILPFMDPKRKRANDEIPYSFWNRLKLTRNVSEFKTLVNSTNTSANLDLPEGGFDAIMQVLACGNKIGWRSNSRKLLLFFTDDEFHYAGDGKLGGIMVPNDEHCHLNQGGFYTENANQDYPSIGQLVNKIADTKVHLVFVVRSSFYSLYERLHKNIRGSAMAVLPSPTDASADHSKLLQIIKDIYDTIRTSIQLKAETDENIEISYTTACINQAVSNTSECANIGIGQSVTFNVTVMARKCPGENAGRNTSLEISPVGISEKLVLDIEYVCQCDCEESINLEPNSTECSGNGTLQCGDCRCNKGYLGHTCQCYLGNMDLVAYENRCKKPGSMKICEDQGDCVCGKCVNCRPIPNKEPLNYTGDYCHCDDSDCPTIPSRGGQLCGGPTRGQCVCGKCKCEKGFTGDDCGCVTDNKNCRDLKGGLCNGNGECECGECKCKSSYEGKQCDAYVCRECDRECASRKDCVICRLRNDETCLNIYNCTNYDFKYVDAINANSNRSCEFRDSNNCTVYFTFSDSDVIQIQTCPPKADETVIIAAVVSAVIGLGLLALMLWKLIVTVHDKREYGRFIKASAKEEWKVKESGLYKDPNSTFQNPMFDSSS